MTTLVRLILLLILTSAPVATMAGAAAAQAAQAAQTTTPVVTQDLRASRDEPARIEAELVPMSAWTAPGSTAIVAVHQKIAPGWHTYWRNPGDSGGATSLVWTLPAGVTADGIVWPLPTRQRLLTLMNYGYSGEVYLPVPIQIPPSARPGRMLTLKVEALFLVCSDRMCVPEARTLNLNLKVQTGAAPLDPRHGAAIARAVELAPRPAAITAHIGQADGQLVLTAAGGPLAGADLSSAYFFPFEGRLIDHAALQTGRATPEGLSLNLTRGRGWPAGDGDLAGILSTDRGAWEITATPGPPLIGVSDGRALVDTEGESAMASAGGFDVAGLLRTSLFALIGGLILNLMPCVFPILAMKAASLAVTAHDPRAARRDGLLFLAGVVSTFLALAILLLSLKAAGQAIGWGFQLQSPAVVAVLALIMLAVALNLSGVFEVGAGLQAVGGARLSRLPGGVGAFFTGVLAVVVAAPCTAPFMAVALGAALIMPWPAALLVFVMLGLGLALPYVVVSLSPRILALLPRPGAWMERLKGVLAFPMYGAALWLAWVFARQAGDEALGLMLLAGLMFAFGLWLTGINQARRAEGMSADGKGGSTAVISAIAATLTLIAAIGITGVAITQAKASAGEASAGTSTPDGPLSAQPWSTAAVRAAQAEGRPVLVNFTADWCVTCKINEGAALSSPRVAEALNAANAVYLKADWTRPDAAIAAELARHGRSGVPLYLLYLPGIAEPRVLPQLLSEGLVVKALEPDRLRQNRFAGLAKA